MPALASFDGHSKMVHKERTIGKAGKAVVESVMQQLLFGTFPLGYVHEHTQRPGYNTGIVHDRSTANQHGHHFAGFLFYTRLILPGDTLFSLIVRTQYRFSAIFVKENI